MKIARLATRSFGHAKTGRTAPTTTRFHINVFLSRNSAYVSTFVTDPRLGELAAELLGCRRIRFMQDVLHEVPDKRDTPCIAIRSSGRFPEPGVYDLDPLTGHALDDESATVR